jgi:alpha-1,6-mannosyltransferase
VAGATLVALAACVKVPAAIGLLYIGWEWLGDDAGWRERVRPTVSTILVGAGTMFVVTEWVGLGWGWVAGLGNPDTLIFWTTPTTLAAIVAGNIVHAVGLPAHVRGLLTLSRLTGALAAAVISVRLFWRSDRRSSGRAIGLTLLLVTVLGPVIEPWYLAWGIVLLAAVAEPRMRAWLVALSCCFAFLGLPGGMTLVRAVTGNAALALGVGLPLCVTAAFALSSRLRRLLGDGERSRTRRPLPEGTTV